MINSKERKDVESLSGIPPNHRDASAPRIWSDLPTAIIIPKNTVRYQSSNPLNKTRVGNQTSQTTFLGAQRPPRKKQKLNTEKLIDIAPMPLKKRETNARPPLAPENIIGLDDDSVYDTHSNMASSDPMNIKPSNRSHSKVQWSTKSSTTLAPDINLAPGTREFDDPIEQFSDGDSPILWSCGSKATGDLPPKGIVGERKDQFEGNSDYHANIPKKINLREMKKKGKGKAKEMKRKFPFEIEIDVEARNLLSTLSTKPQDYEPLPVKEYYVDQHLFNSNGLEVLWKNNPLLMKFVGSKGFVENIKGADLLSVDRDENNESGTCSLKLILAENSKHITIKFDVSNPKNLKKYNQLLSHLGKVQKIYAARTNLWQMAEELARIGGVEHERDRMAELNEIQARKATRSSHPDRASERYTPLNVFFPSSTKAENPTKNIDFEGFSDVPKLRRSSRHTVSSIDSKSVDPNEVILVYPQGSPGAVSINNADLDRLEPQQFLNDTLIEFGLKLWLRDLEAENPELASQVHVFNSFFYKKLNHKKDPQQSFDSVRKWTAKFDIFQKKYIIVPINEQVHWYLAIICEPEHVLRPSVPKAKNTRSSAKSTSIVENQDEFVTSSEAEVERNLNDDFHSSCIISADAENQSVPSREERAAENDGKMESAFFSNHESSKVAHQSLSPTASQYNPSTRSRSTSSANDKMVIDVDNPPKLFDRLTSSVTIETTRFYSKPGKGKKKMEPNIHPVTIESDQYCKDEVNECPKTYIFTFDSLGTRHPQAVKKLGNYLKMEANDKKGISNATAAEGKFAAVPVQPNFCDCGLYLLHFAQTFMSDPKKYSKSILSQKTKLVDNKDRQELWNGQKVASMRTELSNRILQLSDDWKKERVMKDEVTGQMENDTSDSEIEIGAMPARNVRDCKAKRMRG